ncbi:hypothetical protein Ciccas_007571 [Cichlidogyrus casuarinus]|uniref:SET domain-containing protein n=1 Tax=Cichlidogyrus casuarinus TaxID=1844966 RepID=A0ABD2Q2K1_9PLAT
MKISYRFIKELSVHRLIFPCFCLLQKPDKFKQIWKSALAQPDNKSILELVEFVIYSEHFEDLVPDASTKSDVKALKLKEAGNELWAEFTKSGKLESLKAALAMYQKSVIYAQSDEVMAFCFTNRVRVLCEFNLLEAALIDMTRALELPKISSLTRAKLQFREIQLLQKLQRWDQVTDKLAVFEESLKSMDSNKEINKLLTSTPSLKTRPNFKPSFEIKLANTEKELREKWGHLITTENPISASDKVVISSNSTSGVGLFAKRDIQAGELLLVDVPVMAYVKSAEHCETCGKLCYNMLPCTACIYGQFCSESCRQVSMGEVPVADNFRGQLHRYLCQYNETAICKDFAQFPAGTDPKLMQLRVGGGDIVRGAYLSLAKFGGERIARFIADHPQLCYPLTGQRPTYQMLDQAGFGNLHPDHVASTTWLSNNFEKRPKHHLIMFAVHAIRLARILHMKGFQMQSLEQCLSKQQCEKDKPSFQHMAAFIVHYVMVMSTNAHASYAEIFSAFKQRNDWFLRLDQNDANTALGGGLYPNLSLFNHSCCPNLTRLSMCPSMYLIAASRNIKKGEELLDTYSTNFSAMAKDERQTDLLAEYFFRCQCDACEQNWPMNGLGCPPICEPGGCSKCHASIAECKCPTRTQLMLAYHAYEKDYCRFIEDSQLVPYKKFTKFCRKSIAWTIKQLRDEDSFLNRFQVDPKFPTRFHLRESLNVLLAVTETTCIMFTPYSP